VLTTHRAAHAALPRPTDKNAPRCHRVGQARKHAQLEARRASVALQAAELRRKLDSEAEAQRATDEEAARLAFEQVEQADPQ
jgi:hypothetical protein